MSRDTLRSQHSVMPHLGSWEALRSSVLGTSGKQGTSNCEQTVFDCEFDGIIPAVPPNPDF